MPAPQYDLFSHGRMIRDRGRTDAYARAIAAAVKPGSVVVDLGTGSGIFAVLAARAGARKVYAIESEEIASLARDVVAANGVGDVVEVLHASSRDVELPERADVLLADVHGVLPFFRTSLASMIDARVRFLRDGGAVIPAVDTVRGALVESPAAYEQHDQPWSGGALGVDLSPARTLALSDMRKREVEPREVISPFADVTRLDYAAMTSPGFASSVRFVATRDATAHGFTLWFDSQLAEGVTLTNAPDAAELLYGRVFVPFERPFAVREGHEVGLELAARLINDDDYLWRWTTSHRGRELFRQSNFFGVPQMRQ